MTSVVRGTKETQREEETPDGDEGRDRCDADASQEMPVAVRGKEGYPPEFWRDRGPAETLNSDFWSPEQRDKEFLLL